MRTDISTHSDNDDHRHYEFARRYPYPIATERRISPDAVVAVLTIAIGAFVIAAGLLGYL